MTQKKEEHPELKTEEGYSAEIVPTYIPGEEIYVRTMSHKGYMSTREMLCGHSADIMRTYISRDICPHNVRTVSFFGFQLSLRCIFMPQEVPKKAARGSAKSRLQIAGVASFVAS